VMCPSYLATNDEMHSTRGRARLLFEMLHGGPIDNLWRSKAVEEALDLCLGCKGCKSDCPVHVDMATYKAEFRAHHYQRRIRPRAAYSMGMIHAWSRIASHAPWFANALTQAPFLSAIAKVIAGIAPQRRMPRFARESFAKWFQNRRKPAQHGKQVMLWPDTFNNYFRPQTAIAASHVLDSLGYDVIIPNRSLCCGRPLYDWGMLDRAKALWTETMTELAPVADEGIPIVGLEPACVSAFRGELVNLFPDDPRAARLCKQMQFITEFVERNCGGAPLTKIDKPALVKIHCHQHAVIGLDAEREVLRRIGLSHQFMPSGCCGMAGSFGFEVKKFDLSMKLAERSVIPAVRKASADTLIIANGFSCREQIEQCTGRETLHIAELLASG
jgi:Fe-S oxidoreductase